MTDAANAIKSLILAKAAPTLLKSPTHDLNLKPAPLEQPGPALHPSDLPKWPHPSAWVL